MLYTVSIGKWGWFKPLHIFVFTFQVQDSLSGLTDSCNVHVQMNIIKCGHGPSFTGI